MWADILPILTVEEPVAEARRGGLPPEKYVVFDADKVIKLRRLLDDEEILITMRSTWPVVTDLDSSRKFTTTFHKKFYSGPLKRQWSSRNLYRHKYRYRRLLSLQLI